jgi:transglutaminase-like putative cysteine protease
MRTMTRQELLRLRDIALDTLPKPEGKTRIVKKNAANADIVRAVLDSHARFKSQAAAFAAAAFGTLRTQRAQVAQAWHFLKHGIEYRLDPADHQWVKSPAATFHSGFADCKALSIFAAGILRGLGIPHTFRFASYSPDPTPTHVYVVAHLPQGDVPLDPVFTTEGAEKAYTYNQDYPMNISEISGHGDKAGRRAAPAPGGKMRGRPAPPPRGRLLPRDLDPQDLTEGQMTLFIHRQRLQLKADAARALRGIGSTLASRLDQQVAVADDLWREWESPGGTAAVLDQHAEGVYGIGRTAAQRQADRAQRREERKAGGPGQDGRLRNVVDSLKKAAGAAVKAATALPRLALKGALEVGLPKAAPAFLYLFVNTPAAIQALPEKARRKRAKSEKIFKFITDGLGMKEAHVKGILRNGILKKYGKEPEAVLADQLKTGISGIGLLDDVIEFVIKVIKKIAESKKDGKEAPEFSASDMPDPSDFGAPGSPANLQLARAVKAQPTPGDIPDGAAGGPANPFTPPKRGIC